MGYEQEAAAARATVYSAPGATPTEILARTPDQHAQLAAAYQHTGDTAAAQLELTWALVKLTRYAVTREAQP